MKNTCMKFVFPGMIILTMLLACSLSEGGNPLDFTDYNATEQARATEFALTQTALALLPPTATATPTPPAGQVWTDLPDDCLLQQANTPGCPAWGEILSVRTWEVDNKLNVAITTAGDFGQIPAGAFTNPFLTVGTVKYLASLKSPDHCEFDPPILSCSASGNTLNLSLDLALSQMNQFWVGIASFPQGDSGDLGLDAVEINK